MNILKKQIVIKTLLVALLVNLADLSIFATPLNNQKDPHPIYTPIGLDKFYTKRSGKIHVALNLSPFYQHSGSAKNKDYVKVPAGDIKGQWDMFGVFLNAPESVQADIKSTGSGTKYPNLHTATTALYAIATGGRTKYTELTDVLKTALNDTPGTSRPFDPDTYNYNYESNKINYEKLGLRGQLNFEIGAGIGLLTKGGVADYRQGPKFDYESVFAADYSGSAGTTDPSATSIYTGFLSSDMRDKIFKDLKMSIDSVRTTVLEDTLVQAYWQLPIKLKDKSGDTVVTMVPYLAVGAWLPTCQKRDTNRLFTMSGGNDSHYGLAADFALSFDFPEMVQASIGGGLVGYDAKELKNYPVPTHKYQSGFYPWKANIKRDPGVTWYMNVSMKAPDFIKDLSAYFDFVYTQHERDTITVKGSDLPTTDDYKTLFLPQQLEEESDWTSQQYNIGMDYRITPHLVFGAGLQAQLTGKRVYRPTTILGTVKLEF